jgi:hypothetical protein
LLDSLLLSGMLQAPELNLHHVCLRAVEEQLALVTSSGRPFQLIDVRIVAEDGADVAKDGVQVMPVMSFGGVAGMNSPCAMC